MEGGDLRMSTVDERIVRMTLDNHQFQAAVADSIGSLNKLNQGLRMEGATKGLADVDATVKGMSFGKLGDAVDGIANKFKTMSIVGITALTNIVNKATDAGLNLVKSLTIAPVLDGFHEYETKLNSIQTILANTAHEGTNLEQVNAALAELNHYSDQTIYNFGEMARNIGTFTAAGVSLKTSTEAIKGIANLAAISGSNAQQASTAMYQLSQALAAGKVSLEDWNSVVNAGMGGKVFQDALMETARLHGVAIDKMVKDEGSFRMTLQKGWLTSSILTETLSKFTGDLNAQQLKTMGYNDKQIADIIKMGATAQDAATKVKTFSQLVGTLQEAVGSGWAETWQLLFGDFEEARTLFTNVNNVIGGFISSSSEARNKVIGDWKEMGGRTVLIQAIGNTFHALIEVVKPIKDAFREIFPPTTGKQLFAITQAIEGFTKKLIIGSETADKIKRVFAGFFAVLDVGWEIVKKGVSTLFDLLGFATKGSGKFLDYAASIGDFLVKLRDAGERGNVIAKVFNKIENAVKKPIEFLREFVKKIGELFGTIDISGTGAAKAVTGLVAKLKPLAHLGDSVGTAWSKIVSVLGDIWDGFYPLAEKLVNFFKGLGHAITDALGGIDAKTVLKGIQTGLFAGLLLLLKQLIGKMKGEGEGGLTGFLDPVKEAIEGLTGTLSSLQNTLRAATLLQIAAAIGILAASLYVLSKIEPRQLVAATWAITVMFTNLFGAIAIFEKTIGVAGLAKLPLVTGAMILLATSIVILAAAVRMLSGLDWNGLIKGLTGVGVLLAEVVLAVKFMPPSAQLTSTALGLIVLGVAVNILARAVKYLAQLDWQQLAKGLVAVGAILGELILFTKFMEADALSIGASVGIAILAASMLLLAKAMKDFGQMSWTEIGKGLAAMAGSLLLIGTAISLIPPTAPLSAAGILIVAASLGMIGDAIAKMGALHGKEIAKGLLAIGGALTFISLALAVLPPTALLSAAAIFIVAASLGMIGDALKKMGQMSWTEIAKSLIMLAASLTIIGVAVTLMVLALPGAAALLVVAAALLVLLPVVQTFSQMSWTEMAKGLLMLAGVFTVLGVAGLLLGPLVPVLLGLSTAILILGAGTLLAGAGVLLFATGLSALAVAGAAGAAAIVGIVSGLIGLIPVVMEEIGKGIVAFAKVISTAGPAITEAITTVILALCDAIIKTIPKVVETLLKLLTMMLDTMNKYVPHLVQAGFDLLLAILRGIRNNIGQVAEVTLQIIAEYINGIARGLPGVIQAGVNLILAFINGMADAIRGNSKAMGDAGGNLASAVIEGMVNGLAHGGGKVAQAAKNLAERAYNAAKDFLDINSPSKKFRALGDSGGEGFSDGFDRSVPMVEDSAQNMGKSAMQALMASIAGMSDLMTSDIDVTPTITPVLDLTGVKKDASQIGDMLSGNGVVVDRSFSNAAAASAGYQANVSAANQNSAMGSVSPITFVQNNTSPKALSTAEIYRDTNSLISAAKGVLATV
jgi:tape measure domain-containing protein